MINNQKIAVKIIIIVYSAKNRIYWRTFDNTGILFTSNLISVLAKLSFIFQGKKMN